MKSRVVRWLLTIAASAGVVGTGVAAAKGGMKTAKKDLRGLSLKDKIAEVAPDYIWAAVIGGSAIGCIFANTIISDVVEKNLSSALLAAQSAYLGYKKRTEKFISEDQSMACGMKGNIKKAYEIYDKLKEDEILCYDPYLDYMSTGGYFGCNPYDFLAAKYAINEDMAINGEAHHADFYRHLGVKPPAMSEIMGWSYGAGTIYGYSWIHVELDGDDGPWTLDDGLEVHPVKYYSKPTEDYLDY